MNKKWRKFYFNINKCGSVDIKGFHDSKIQLHIFKRNLVHPSNLENKNNGESSVSSINGAGTAGYSKAK